MIILITLIIWAIWIAIYFEAKKSTHIPVIPISTHPDYDTAKLRVMLAKDSIRKLPIKIVSYAELYDIKSTWTYNPKWLYDFSIGRNVVGHDLRYRYVLKKGHYE